MIASLPLASWLLLLVAVGTGLALVIPFWLSHRGRSEGGGSPKDGGEPVSGPDPVAHGPGAGVGEEL